MCIELIRGPLLLGVYKSLPSPMQALYDAGPEAGVASPALDQSGNLYIVCTNTGDVTKITPGQGGGEASAEVSYALPFQQASAFRRRTLTNVSPAACSKHRGQPCGHHC